MMLLALVLSGLLLAFAAFAAVGLPYLVMGARAFEEFGERPDAQAIACVLAAAAALIAALPFVAPALISPGPQVQVFAETVLGAASPFRS
jgi:succinate dehydrogenase/fumarate reductase cytochrome b subunit